MTNYNTCVILYLFAVRHSNKRLIDAKMVTWEGARWVTFQVTEAVRRIIMRGKRNGGFEVHVRDMEENILDAKSIIDPTVCSSINSKSYKDCIHLANKQYKNYAKNTMLHLPCTFA